VAVVKERKGGSLNVKMKEQVWVDGSAERVECGSWDVTLKKMFG
jgi:hypothetical protein